MSVNASRGCKHMSWCADGEQRRNALDRKSTWLGVPEFLPMHICRLPSSHSMPVAHLARLGIPPWKRWSNLKDRSQCVDECAALVRSLFQRGTKVYSRDATAATATQRKRCFVNAKSFPLTRNRILTSSCDFYIQQCMYGRSTVLQTVNDNFTESIIKSDRVDN